MTKSNDDIVFEDLHGVPDQHSVEVDLDASEDGIRRYSADEQPSDEDGVDDESDDLSASDDAEDDESGQDDELAASGEEDDDEEPSQPRNAFQKRLDRERRAKLKARRDAEEARTHAQELERQLQEQSQTISESQRQQIENDIKSSQAELKNAFENGDTDKQVELTVKLSELQAKKLVADRQQPPKPEGQPEGGMPKLAQTWMKKNGDWFRQPGFERFTRAANRIDSELYQEGYDVNSRDYYQELDKRLSSQFPDMFDEKPGKRDGKPRDRRSTVASVDGAPTSRSKRALSGRIELGAEDFRVMRAFGLDPNDPAHLKEFAASRRERLAAENANRRGR